MKRHWSYLKYVLVHKWHVLRAGLKIGVPLWQLLIHDWSKFLSCEWFPYARTFYKPDGSHQYAPDGTGFDVAWNHHQKHQPHHWQYWLLNWDQPRGKWNVQEVQPGTGFILAHNGQPTRFTCPEISAEDNGAAYQADYQLLRGVVNQLNNAPVPLPMPDCYRREMLADWRGAGLALGKPDTRGWYLANRENIQLHPETRAWVEEQLGV